MVNPLAVPFDRSAHTTDAYLAAAVREIARGDLSRVPVPPSEDRWVTRAARHGILSSLLAALRGADHPLPPPLRGYRIAAATRRLRLLEELRRLGAVLDAAGVAWLLVKGPVLGEVVYRHPGSRECTDLDLLVDPAQLKAAIEALTADGAQVLGADWSQRTWARGAEVPMRSASGVDIDLHWHLLNRHSVRSTFTVETTPLLQRRVRREVAGVEVPTPDDLDLVLHVLLHACLDGCGRLRALLDVQQSLAWLQAQGHTPHDLADRAGQLRLQAPAFAAITAAADQIDAAALEWAAALRGVTMWARGVRWLARRPSGSALTNGLTRRLYRYTMPTTPGSLARVAGYGGSRVVRFFSPDHTQLSAVPTAPDEPHFVAYLDHISKS